MRSRVVTIAALMILATASADAADFEQHFEDATLRVDFYHTGDATTEQVTIDRVLRQGPWAGPRAQLIDPFSYGSYVVEARDAASGELLVTQGFDSYFGEYRTTAPALDGRQRTYHETVLLPFPRKPVKISFLARLDDGGRRLLGETVVDPTAAIAAEPPARGALIVEAHIGGEPATTLDIAILGEGYTKDEADLFRADLGRAAKIMLGFEPFAHRRSDVSIRGVLLPSAESGCDEPTRGAFRDTALSASFNSLGSERYLLTEDNRRVRDVAANVPYDALIIMINHDRYGGGGIYRLFCTFTARSDWAGYLLMHEFGHSFAGLADEYYSSSVAYNDFYPRGREPDAPNITALLDPAAFKWGDLVETGTPLPTPWRKAAYDAADEAYQAKRRELNDAIAEAVTTGAPHERVAQLRRQEEEHARQHSEWTEKFLRSEEWAGRVGAFEGAGYSSEGLFRPQLDCLMFSRRLQPYCAVCERAVEAMIDRYAAP